MVHWSNEAQPAGVASDAAAGEDQSLAKLRSLGAEVAAEVNKIADEPDSGSIVDDGKLGRFVKMLNIHCNTMKYKLELEDRSIFANMLMTVYRTCRLSNGRKESVLNSIKKMLCKDYLTVPSFALPWEELWDEALDLVTRANNRGSEVADTNYGQVPHCITDLLHTCRPYIPDEQVESVVSRAMAMLEDVTQPSCAEGLLLLINCLPTAYANYDALLPRWLAIWDRLRHNQAWDACWLTLFCRARKHSDAANPAWASLSTLLQVKVRTYLALPGTSNVDSHFPFRFHSFYDALIPTLGKGRTSHSQVAVMKAAKIMYYFTLRTCTASELVEVDPIPMSQTLGRGRGNGNGAEGADGSIPGYNAPGHVRPATTDLLALLQSIRPFVYPSNTGPWSNGIACMLAVLCSEISRHAGRNLARSVTGAGAGAGASDKDHAALKLRGHAVFEQPLHLGTLRFLLGTLCSLAIEGVYSKSGTLQQLCSASIRNLIGVDPTLGKVVAPFLLQSLDPSAVSQSHQAPAAMAAFTTLTKPLLYPCPVLLESLPQLLELSLPGVDANDVKKSVVTLKMYAGILAVLPVRARYATPGSAAHFPPPYLSLLACDDPDTVASSTAFAQTYSSYVSPAFSEAALASLAAAFESWAPRLLDRIFGILDASEEAKKGVPPSSTASLIETVIHNLFLALEDGGSSALRTSLEDRLVAYLRDSSNVNAAKACARVAGQCTQSPGFLPKLVAALATPEVLTQQCSNDRLVCRLSILGGAARSGPGDSLLPFLSVWRALTAPAFVYHGEKPVRKAGVKLCKELMRGLTSFYPELLPSGRGSAEMPVLGAPIDRAHLLDGCAGGGSAAFKWHCPSAASLSAAVGLMRGTAYTAMEEVLADARAAQGQGQATGSSSGNDSEKKENKKVEERIAFRLKLVAKVLRGASEVLGDALSTPNDMQVEGEEEEEEAQDQDDLAESAQEGSYPAEGLRTRALQGLAPEEAQVLTSFRGEVLRVLLELRTALRLPVPAPGTSEDKDKDKEETDVASLSSSVMLHKGWAKLFTFLVCRRSCTNKSMEMAKRWQAMSLNMSRTILTKTVRRALQLMNPAHTAAAASLPALVVAGEYSAAAWREMLARRTFWDGHGVATDEHVRRIFIQHYARLGQWSYDAMRRALRPADDSSKHARRPLIACLNFLTDVCCHEYDAVREAGSKAFSVTVMRYGMYANAVVKRLLSQALSAGTSYAQAAGALRLLSWPYIMARVLRSWPLFSSFLTTLCDMPSVVATLDTDPAKKEVATLNAVALFVKYATKWSHAPITQLQIASHSPADMVRAALGRVGFSSGSAEEVQGTSMDVEDKQSGASASASATTTTTTTFAGSGGIRFDAFNSFIVLGLLGHPDMPQPPSDVWGWATRTTASAHGQPAQQIAWAVLARLCVLLVKAQARTQGNSHAQEQAGAQKLLRCSSADKGVWGELLPGIAAAHPKSGEDGDAQWSGGVESVLKAASVSLCPHRTYSLAFEGNVVSSHFMRESCVLFINMCQAGIIDVLDKGNVAALLEVAHAKLGPGGSDAETRRNNTTHAELFGALLRALADSAASADGGKDTATHREVAALLLKHYETALDKLSLEFARDWDEALLLALSGPPTDALVPFLTHVGSSFKLAIGSGTPEADAGEDGDAADEGFNRQGRRMVTTAVMLRAMITSSWQGQPSQARAAVATDLASSVVTAKSGIISSYRTSRSYMSGILRSLLVRGQHGGSLPSEMLRGLYSTVVELAESSVDSGEATGTGSEAQPKASPLLVSSSSGTDTGSGAGAGAGAGESKESDVGKHAMEIACSMLDTISSDFPVLAGVHRSSEAQRSECERCVVALARCAIKGCGHPDPEIASRSRQSCVNFAEAVTRGLSEDPASDVLGSFLRVLQAQAKHPSFRVRLIVAECVMMVMMDKWTCLTAVERTLVKDVFTAGFADSVPEVLQQSQAGFAGYLSFKTPSELQKLAEAFCRNSDKYVTLEKQRKKGDSGASAGGKPDLKFTNMVHMMCCIVLTFPYDLPAFLPQLLACTVRHSNTPSLKETISRTVLEFRRTHQDRWSDFKELFSAEQLDSLSGATQVSYMS